jgi:putative two-component system response regulator
MELSFQMTDVNFNLSKKATILVIDDEPLVRLTVEGLFFQKNVELIFAENGTSGLAIAQEVLPDAILLDLMMPDIDGYEICRRMRSNPALAEVPIIMITAVDNREARLAGLDAGVDDFLTKPFDTLEIQIKVKNILKLNRFRNLIDQRNDLIRANEELVITYDKTIEGWSNALDLRDQETEGHTIRVVETSLKLARLVGISGSELLHFRRGALLHDIGKLGIPDSILLKPGKLTDEEWVIMRMHPVYAYEWLSKIDYLLPALDIPYCHHERWNGSGYPRGLKGNDIPLAARIFSIIDVWDALRSERPYRKAMPENEVRAYIADKKEIEFDPTLVDIFLEKLTI